MIDSKHLVEDYLSKNAWAVEENSNTPFGLGAMQRYFGEEVSKRYWLEQIYNEDIAEAHVSGDLHIHDLNQNQNQPRLAQTVVRPKGRRMRMDNRYSTCSLMACGVVRIVEVKVYGRVETLYQVD